MQENSSGITFVSVDAGGEGMANNGITKVVRSGKLITFKAGADKVEEELGEGLIVEGTFVGSTPNKYNPDKLDYLIRASDSTLFVLNGAATLTRQMAKVTTGELIQVLYNGRKTVKRKAGGSASMHNFKVLRALNASDEAAG